MTVQNPPPYSPSDIKRFRVNYQEEVDGAALYRLLAAAERDPHLREVFERLAVSEDRHLNLWEGKLREAGVEIPARKPTRRVRFLGWIARRFGTSTVMPIVTRMEMAATDMYDNQPEAVEANLPADERSHARIFREIGRDGTGHGTAVDIARVEGRHRSANGNALRAAVLGANDGLVSNLSLVMGVAGADPGRDIVLLAGIGGLLAGSLSMALGEWISVRSSTEAYMRQVQVERDELELFPEEEEEELTLIYQSKGLARADAQATARRILTDGGAALDTLVQEELGMSSADNTGNAWIAATTSFVTFGVGALLPVLPWLFIGGTFAIVLSTLFSALGLFAVGAIITLFTGRSVLFSGTRMLAFGLGAAAITFAIGKAIGVGAGI